MRLFLLSVATELLSLPIWLSITNRPWTSLYFSFQIADPSSGVGMLKLLARFFLGHVLIDGELSFGRHTFWIFLSCDLSMTLPLNLWLACKVHIVVEGVWIILATTIVEGATMNTRGRITIDTLPSLLYKLMTFHGVSFINFLGSATLHVSPRECFWLRAIFDTSPRHLYDQ